MRTAALLFALYLSGCTLPNRYPEQGGPPAQWYTAYGLAHVPPAIGAPYASKWITGNPFYGATGVCAGYFAHELEETRNFSRAEWGALDSALDIIVPCAVSFGLSLHLR